MTPFEPMPRDEGESVAGDVSFCGYCGHRPRDAGVRSSRVCAACQLGLLLRAPAAAAPAEHEMFLVVDDLLRIRAVSRGAERLLGVPETQLVGSLISEVLVAADEAAQGGPPLVALLARATQGISPGRRPAIIAVRPRDTFGVRSVARIGSCSPEPAALIVLGEPL